MFSLRVMDKIVVVRGHTCVQPQVSEVDVDHVPGVSSDDHKTPYVTRRYRLL